MSNSQKSDTNRKELIEIVKGLPPTKVVQVLEFAKRLQSPAGRDPASVMKAIQRTRGKYREVLSSSQEFAARKSDERQLENR